jgi:hypothetical protein
MTRNTKWSAASVIGLSGLMFGLLMALSLPDDVLIRSELVRTFADVMASLIPSIGNMENMSSFPQATRLFFSTMWSLVPVQIVAMLLVPGFIDIEKILQNFSRTNRVSSRFMAHVSFLFLVVVVVGPAIFLMGGDKSDTAGCVASHLIGASVVSPIRGHAAGEMFLRVT